MDLHLNPEQEQLVSALSGLYSKHSSTERIREVEPSGFDADLWNRVHALGILDMGVPERSGGGGATLLDMALAAEQQGRYLAPIPAIEATVAARLLAHCEDARAQTALQDVLSGDRLVVFSPRPVRQGRVRLVPGGSVADEAIIFADEHLYLAPLAGQRTTVRNIGSMALADVWLDEAATPLRINGGQGHPVRDAVNEWLVLTAAALVGLSAHALEIGVSYVRERKAFGSPVGSYQAISHPLADSATAIDGARLLTYEAAWAQDSHGVIASEIANRAAELAPMAFAFAAETAADVTYRSLHFHGGYGFMMEYDIQMYYRRARAWANVFAEPEQAYRMVGDRRYGDEPTSVDDD